jgi:hypothetical protein
LLINQLFANLLHFIEAATFCNEGKFMELADELVKKYGVVFIASAGNNGPALTTVGSPVRYIYIYIYVCLFVNVSTWFYA